MREDGDEAIKNGEEVSEIKILRIGKEVSFENGSKIFL